MAQPVQTINLSVVPFSHVLRSSATVITRTVPNLLKVVIKDSKSQSVNHDSVDRWEIAVAQDFRQQTPILAGNGLVEESGGILSVILDGHTSQMQSFMDGKRSAFGQVALVGLDAEGERLVAYQWECELRNVLYEPDKPVSEAPAGIWATVFYVQEIADLIPKDASDLSDNEGRFFDREYDSLNGLPEIPSDIKELGDEDNLLFDGDYNSLQNLPTIPPDLTGDLAAKEDAANKATDFAVIDDNKFPTIKAVKDFAQNETLTVLTGTEVTVAPWTQSKWSASGTCSLTASGWAASGHQIAYIVITLAAGATFSVSGATVADDDALSAAGVYECYIKNVDGKKYFRVVSFTEAS